MQTIMTKMELIKFEYFKIKLNILFKKQSVYFGQTLILKLSISCLSIQKYSR